MRKPRFLIISLIAITAFIILYWGSWQIGFVSDDWHWLSAAQQHGSIFPDLTANYAGGHTGGSYNPVASLWVNTWYALFGLNPSGFHIASIVLHGVNAFLAALLAFVIFRRTVSGDTASQLGLISGVVYLVLPMHVEAIVWMSSIPHLLAATGVLGSLLLYAWGVSRASSWYLAGSLVCAGVAMLAKEIAVIVPVLILLLETIVLYTPGTKLWRRGGWLVGYLMLCVLFIIARWNATGLIFGTYAENSLVWRPWQWINTLSTFGVEALSLGTVRSTWMMSYWAHPARFGAVALIAMIGIIVGIHRFSSRAMKFYLWSSVATMCMYMTLGFNRLSQEGERYMYIPALFLVPLVVYAVSKIRYRIMRWIIFAVVLTGSVIGIDHRIQAWQVSGQVAEEAVVTTQAQARRYATVLVVGVPDTISGAHVFRNNIAEAVRMRYPDVSADIIHLPVYTQLHKDHIQTTALIWTADDRGLLARATGERVVTGFDRRMTPWLTYELWNYDYAVFSSDTIRLIFTPEFQSRLRAGSAVVLGWTQGRLEPLPWP